MYIGLPSTSVTDIAIPFYLRRLDQWSPLHLFFSVMMSIFGIVIIILEQQKAIFPARFRMFVSSTLKFCSNINHSTYRCSLCRIDAWICCMCDFGLQIEHWFLFLSMSSGRGLFYFYVGAVQAAISWRTSAWVLLPKAHACIQNNSKHNLRWKPTE